MVAGPTWGISEIKEIVKEEMFPKGGQEGRNGLKGL